MWLTYSTCCLIGVIIALLSWVALVLVHWIFGFVLLLASAVKAHKDFHNGVDTDFTETGLLYCDQGCPPGVPPRRVEPPDGTPWFVCGRCGAGLMVRHDRFMHGRMTWRDALRDQWFERKYRE